MGSIVLTKEGKSCKKGEEFGHFKYGGSTIVLLFEKGRMVFDSDLVANSKAGEGQRFFLWI